MPLDYKTGDHLAQRLADLIGPIDWFLGSSYDSVPMLDDNKGHLLVYTRRCTMACHKTTHPGVRFHFNLIPDEFEGFKVYHSILRRPTTS